MSSSRFSHFYESTNPGINEDDNESMDTQDNNNTSNNDTMVIKAGLRFKSPANTVSFDTAVVNGHDNPCNMTATVIRPSSEGTNGKEVVTYNNLKQGEYENGVIGSVSFKGNGTGVKNGWAGVFQERIYQCNSVKVPILNPMKPFQITVHNHVNSGTYSFSVVCSTTVDQLKKLIKDRIGMNPEEQHLVFSGKNLASGMTMENCRIKEGSQVLLTGRMRGG